LIVRWNCARMIFIDLVTISSQMPTYQDSSTKKVACLVILVDNG
jgi:hypothetical protein